MESSNWKWNYGVEGTGLANERIGENVGATNRTNLVITNVPAQYFADQLEVRLTFEITVEGVTYRIIDRVRTRSVLDVASAIVASPTETPAAKAYAQSIVDSLTAG